MSGRWQWWLVAVAALAAVAAALPLLVFWPELPEPIAVHWSIDLTPDGRMPKRTALLFNLGMIGLALVATLAGARHAYAKGRAVRLLLITLIGGLAAATSAAIVERNLGAATWNEAAPLTGGVLALMLCLPVAAAALAYWAALRAWRGVQPPTPSAATSLPLPEGARAFWSGGASNGWLLALGAGALLAPLTLTLLSPQTPLLMALVVVQVAVLVALELFSRIRVTIDGRGLAVHYGRLGLWTRRVPLEHIAGAQAVKLDALEHGGWGYRGSLRLFNKAAIVVRSGPALELDLQNGKRLFVTVDDAITAARLLHTLIERQAPPAPPAKLSPSA